MLLDDTPNLESLKRQIASRTSEREAADAYYSRERNATVDVQRQVSESIVVAKEALSVRQRRIQEEERDTLRQHATRTRQLAHKEECIARAEQATSDLRKVVLSLQQERNLCQQQIALTRQRLSTVQQQAESALQHIRAEESKSTELQRATQQVNSSRSRAAEEHRESREALESAIRTLEANNTSLTESQRQLAQVASQSETAHSTRMHDGKTRLDDLHREYDALKAELAHARQLLSDVRQDEESAVRNYRKADEESAREYVADRKAEHARSAAAAEEHLRAIRSSYDQQAREILTALEESAAAIGPLRDESERLFEQELRLLDEVAQHRELIGGIDALQERRHQLRERVEVVRSALSAANQAKEAAAGDLVAVKQEVTIVRDIVAPMDDVCASVQQLSDRLFAQRQDLADAAARHIVRKVAIESRIQAQELEHARLQAAIQRSREREGEMDDEVSERRRTLEADMRVLLAEHEALVGKVDDMQNRARLLDASLEHHARQRQLLQEDLENRRELARKAAATLLAQLEE